MIGLFLIFLIIISIVIIRNKKEEQEVLKLLQDTYTMRVYLESDLTTEEIEEVERKLRDILEVDDIKFISKEDEIDNFSSEIMQNYLRESDITLSSYKIKTKINTIKDLKEEYYENITQKIKQIEGVYKAGVYYQLVPTYKEGGISELKKLLEVINWNY